MIDLSDCRCVACDGALSWINAPREQDICEGAITCAACGATYDQVWGVPILAHYEQEDFASLIEVAAAAEQRSTFTPEGLDHWAGLLRDYHAAKDREAFLKKLAPGEATFLPNRYSEWVGVENLTAGETLTGRKVLDVGAGLGFDAYRHVSAGAQVTALEFSPVLTREGRRTLPMIRWIGGLSHVLPFADASFDVVFANAALHHMRDIPAAICEMLRVVRVGGLLITTGDPYRADHQNAQNELAIFNNHPDVLLGFNEGVPRFAEFINALEPLQRNIRPQLFTQALYESRWHGGSGTSNKFREWSFERDRKRLRKTSGSIAMKIKVEQLPQLAARRQKTERPLRAGILARWMTSQSRAMAELTAWAPAEVINAPFPGASGTKFELLNGWQIPTGEPWRQAYRRARWFLMRQPDQKRLTFELWAAAESRYRVLLNGQQHTQIDAKAHTWTFCDVLIGDCAPGVSFAVEIQQQGEPSAFDDGLFRVRNRQPDFQLGRSKESCTTTVARPSLRLRTRLGAWARRRLRKPT